ncbi:MAG: mCpol domain-containing protein, partial [Cyanobacteria bacterium J06555_13]
QAIKKIQRYIEDRAKDRNVKRPIIFNAGDDLLFKGYFSKAELEEMQKIYKEVTQQNLTCSIGYGWSFEEVYMAMKMAKAQPGKNSIVGIEFRVEKSDL